LTDRGRLLTSPNRVDVTVFMDAWVGEMPSTRRGLAVSALTAAIVASAVPSPAQVLETETARLRKKGAVQMGVNYEYQTSSEGHESAVPFVFEYGFNDRLELVVEPVAATRIRPKKTPRASGLGDTEVTLQYLVAREGKWPALALGGEVKFPTAKNSLIGTGKTDWAAILIASKKLGAADLHLNLNYTFVGKPAGANLSNTVGGAVAAMVPLSRRARAYGEVLAITSAGGGEAAVSLTGAPIPEAAGQELVGTLGLGFYVRPKWFLSFGVSYDNTHAVLFRPGITFRSK
jgi:hypothetical protein